MRLHFTTNVVLTFVITSTGVLAPFMPIHAARVSISNLPEPVFVTNTSQALLEAGCLSIPLTEETYFIDTPTDQPLHIVPSDWSGQYLFFCSPASAQMLSFANYNTQNNNQTGSSLSEIPRADALFHGNIASWAGDLTTKALGAVADATKWGVDTLAWMVSGIVKILINVFSGVGEFIAREATEYLGVMLVLGPFTTHPMVKAGWTFIQGIANLGFILALLFIAAATTLRLETYGFKRMLPRLLIAVLFINFSLVIGGLIIDASRITMAAMAKIMAPPGSDGQPAAVGAAVIDATKLIALKEKLDSEESRAIQISPQEVTGMENVEALIVPLVKAILMWFLAGCLIIITAYLFIRYLMLLLLLIVSPLAYLAFAFPMLDNLAKRWWTEFLKYVYMGPLVMFILMLIAKAATDMEGPPSGYNPFLYTLFQFLVVGALLVVAAVSGKQVGMVGAAATVGFVAGRGKQLMTKTAGATIGAPMAFGGRMLERGAGAVGQATGISNTAIGRGLSKTYAGVKKATKSATGGVAGEQFTRDFGGAASYGAKTADWTANKGWQGMQRGIAAMNLGKKVSSGYVNPSGGAVARAGGSPRTASLDAINSQKSGTFAEPETMKSFDTKAINKVLSDKTDATGVTGIKPEKIHEMATGWGRADNVTAGQANAVLSGYANRVAASDAEVTTARTAYETARTATYTTSEERQQKMQAAQVNLETKEREHKANVQSMVTVASNPNIAVHATVETRTQINGLREDPVTKGFATATKTAEERKTGTSPTKA